MPKIDEGSSSTAEARSAEILDLMAGGEDESDAAKAFRDSFTQVTRRQEDQAGAAVDDARSAEKDGAKPSPAESRTEVAAGSGDGSGNRGGGGEGSTGTAGEAGTENGEPTLADLVAKIGALEAASQKRDTDMRTAMGRISAVQSRLDKAASAKAGKPVQVDFAKVESDPEVKALNDEFPDIVRVIRRYAEAAQPVGGHESVPSEQAAKPRNFDELRAVVPEVSEIASSTEFEAWLESKGPEFHAKIKSTPDAAEFYDAVTEYRPFHSAMARRRQQTSQATSAGTGGGNPPASRSGNGGTSQSQRGASRALGDAVPASVSAGRRSAPQARPQSAEDAFAAAFGRVSGTHMSGKR